MKKPPFLKPKDKIGIVCPAGYMPLENIQTALCVLQAWGFEVVVGSTVGAQNNYFAGSDQQRIDDLQLMMDDTSVKAILCARGGYGTGRIIEKLDFTTLVKHPKWIIGFSDITVLHCHLFAKYKMPSMHAPMAAAFNNNEYTNEYVQALHKALHGDNIRISCPPHPFNREGSAKGTLVGGNLSLLTHLIGTSSDINLKNKILFIEDTGEYLYNVDRMLYQLKRNGKFDKLNGLIIGGFTHLKDTEIPFGQTIEELIRDVVEGYDFPVCFNFPISHEKENHTVRIGLKYRLKVTPDKTILHEL